MRCSGEVHDGTISARTPETEEAIAGMAGEQLSLELPGEERGWQPEPASELVLLHGEEVTDKDAHNDLVMAKRQEGRRRIPELP
jgi:hypothetical protein